MTNRPGNTYGAGTYLSRILPAACLLFCFCASILHAQEFFPDTSASLVSTFTPGRKIRFERISLEQGLSQNTIRCILQDRRGFLWFGTEDGVNRYDGYEFRIFQTDPGNPNTLSSNFIRALHEDRNGVIWIGTNGGGLNRFDPTTELFTRIQSNSDDPTAISSDYVWSITEDESGTLWIGTDGGGLNRMTYRKDGSTSFTHYRHEDGKIHSLSDDRIITMFRDNTGTLWLGTRSGGLNAFNRKTGTFTKYTHDPDDPASLSSNTVRAIYQDRSGALWVGTDGGGLNRIVRGTGNTLSFVSYRNIPGDNSSLSSDLVRTIFEDRTDVLWIGTTGYGLNALLPVHRKNGKMFFHRYRHDLNDPTTLSNDIVFSCYEDRAGIVWFGTEFGGITKLDRLRDKFVHYDSDPRKPDAISDRSVWSLLEDRSGVLWIGTRNGGLNRLLRDQAPDALPRFKSYSNRQGDRSSIAHDHIRVMYEDRADRFWVGTDGGGLHLFDRAAERFTRFPENPENELSFHGRRVYTILQDYSGTLWIGTRTAGLNRMISSNGRAEFLQYTSDPENPAGLSNNFVYILYEDRERNLWVGTFSGGLNLLTGLSEDGKRAEFRHFRYDSNNPSSISSDCILSLYQDRSGILWIGTGGGGINRLDPASLKDSEPIFVRYTRKDGLTNGVIYGILEDEKGNLWMSSNNGVFRFDPRKGKFRHFTELDGLQSKEFNGGAYHRNSRGEFMFGGIHGFNVFHPDRITENTYVPPVYITELRVANESPGIGGNSPLSKHVSYTDRIELSYRQNIISFEFVALNYTIPEKNRYMYMLEGVDEDWVYPDSDKRFANYTNLAPGEYRFVVRGSNNDGLWNTRGAAISITITPPYWATWWFRSLLALVVLAIAFLMYSRRLRSVRMKAELETAHNAQMSIMPQADPEIPGLDISGICLPANEVGGDFFDYLKMDGDGSRIGIAVGDVSGKAMNSAMTAVMASGMLSCKVEETTVISDIMTRINGPMYVKTDKNMFVALFLAAIDGFSGVVKFTNAGLVEPLLKSGDSVAVLQSEGPNYPLGLVPECVYRETSYTLLPGDVLIVLSDGVPEAHNAAREEYGTDTIKNFLAKLDTSHMRASEIKDHIISDVNAFTGSAHRHDDITVVVVKFTGQS